MKEGVTMKRTKNMVYQETNESRELFVYSNNKSIVYYKALAPVLENLKKHCKSGNYDTDRAIDAWYRVATIASNEYKKDFGYPFSVGDRFTVAVELEKYYREEIFESINS